MLRDVKILLIINKFKILKIFLFAIINLLNNLKIQAKIIKIDAFLERIMLQNSLNIKVTLIVVVKD